MFAGLLSFLGGSAFRLIWGEISSFLTKRQDHQHELEMMRLQKEMDDAKHSRDLEQMRLANDLGIKTIEVKRDAAVAQAEADAFSAAIVAASKPSGIAWVDAWNGCIRPAFASVALALWVFKVCQQGFAMVDFDLELLAAVAGFFFADRSLGKRGK